MKLKGISGMLSNKGWEFHSLKLKIRDKEISNMTDRKYLQIIISARVANDKRW